MYIVGFTGPINHGKSSAAKFLEEQELHSKHIESWQIVAEVAEKLNAKFDIEMMRNTDLTSINSWLFNLLEILPQTVNFPVSFDQIEIREHELDANPNMFSKLFIYVDRLKDNPGMAMEAIEESNKEEHRPILQWLGGYLTAELSDRIWLNEITRRIHELDDSVQLCTVVGLRFPSDAEVIREAGGIIIEVSRPSQPIFDPADPTEANREQIRPDTIISNNGELQDLENVMKAVWTDLKAGRLRPNYHGIN